MLNYISFPVLLPYTLTLCHVCVYIHGPGKRGCWGGAAAPQEILQGCAAPPAKFFLSDIFNVLYATFVSTLYVTDIYENHAFCTG